MDTIAKLILIATLSWSAEASAAGCDKPGFVFAVDTVDDGPPKAAAPDRFKALETLGKVVAKGLPDQTYEKNTSWRDVTIVRVDCIDDVAMPNNAVTGDTGDFFSVGTFPASPPPGDEIAQNLKIANCSTPVYLLGLNTVTDAPKYAVYARALSESNLPRRYGFRRIFSGVPVKQLAGHWHANTTATLSEWPCREAFEIFYNSPAYRNDIFPLRAGSARYRLVAFSPKDKP